MVIVNCSLSLNATRRFNTRGVEVKFRETIPALNSG